MHLTQLNCQHFRCLSACEFSPSPGLNVIRGHNAQGKTSVLESILYAATTKSHRTSNDSELAEYEQHQFHVVLHATRADRAVTLECHWWQGAKRFKVNGLPQARLSEILGRVPVVFFSPEEIALVQGAASVRRRFLDMEISQIDPAYLMALQSYRQALRQRNEILRAPQPSAEMLSVWDAQLAEYGRIIVEARAGYVEQLSPLASEAYGRVSQAEPLRLAYTADIEPGENFVEVLARQQASDIRRRVTQRGPHRDDVELFIAEKPARSHASQGQQKTAALSIKLAELELVRARVGEYPVLLLDEVLAELDEQRSRRLFQAINEGVQCIATTTEQAFRSDRFGTAYASFRIEQGQLAQEHAD